MDDATFLSFLSLFLLVSQNSSLGKKLTCNTCIFAFSHEIALLSIYFKSGHFLSVMRHEWHGVPDLLSKVGGYFSLFTGMSMVSIMELIYFLTIRIICNKSRYGHWAGPQ
jgi:hypothetical protein